METSFTCKGSNDTAPGTPFHVESLAKNIASRVDAHAGPWLLHGPGAGNQLRSHRFAKKHFAGVISAGKLGDDFKMENPSHKIVVWYHVVPGMTKGEHMLADEKDHFGAPYLLGGNAPGPSDCSGWVIHEYEKYGNFIFTVHHTVEMFTQLGGHVGVYPHLGTGANSVGEIFDDEKLCKTGDLVFKAYPAFSSPSDNPDHVGLWVRPGIMRDTRSVTETLNDRTIDEGLGQTLYGRVLSVNGKLR